MKQFVCSRVHWAPDSNHPSSIIIVIFALSSPAAPAARPSAACSQGVRGEHQEEEQEQQEREQQEWQQRAGKGLPHLQTQEEQSLEFKSGLNCDSSGVKLDPVYITSGARKSRASCGRGRKRRLLVDDREPWRLHRGGLRVRVKL